MDSGGGGGRVPGSLLGHLRLIVHGAVGVMLLEVGRDTVSAVGHPDPIVTDVANAPNIRQIRIYITDQETAAVARSKIAKKKTVEAAS